MTDEPLARLPQYTIRRQVFRLFGAGFHIVDGAGNPVGFCRQKAFRLREDIRIYTDDACQEELLVITTQSVWDISGAYTVRLRDGSPIGAFKRHGGKSLVRDSWTVFGSDGREIGAILEDSQTRALLRRLHEGLAVLLPQTHLLRASDGAVLAEYRTRFHPIVHRLDVIVHGTNETFDDLLALAGGCLLGAIEGRQRH